MTAFAILNIRPWRIKPAVGRLSDRSSGAVRSRSSAARTVGHPPTPLPETLSNSSHAGGGQREIQFDKSPDQEDQITLSTECRNPVNRLSETLPYISDQARYETLQVDGTRRDHVDQPVVFPQPISYWEGE